MLVKASGSSEHRAANKRQKRCTLPDRRKEKGENNSQIVINGALHHSDYVTKFMKRLNDQSVDPKVVLELGFSQSYQ